MKSLLENTSSGDFFFYMIEILFENKHWIIVNKPSGMFVHPSELNRQVKESCMKLLRDQVGHWVYPVHRIDRGTSGALLFAKNAELAKVGAKAFEEKKVRKKYLLLCRGYLPSKKREWVELSYPISVEEKNEKVEAITRYSLLATAEIKAPVGRYQTARYSLVLAEPITGRMHQIRKHFSHLRHPLIGDQTYGDLKQNRFFEEKFSLRRLMLHSFSLEYEDGDFSFSAKAEATFLQPVLEKLGLSDIKSLLEC
jgi:tRNA pseudouridine65 synthase